MTLISNRLPYRQTAAFSRIILDYLDRAESLKDFYAHPVSLQGIIKASEARQLFPTDRQTLVNVLEQQYKGVGMSDKTKKNIEALKSNTSFTITTAHQNNIFTGPLYFIYKILHAVKLAEQLSELIPGKTYVPVYYIGSEDADLEELNHIWLGGEKLQWDTKQTGAVGRMKIDKALVALIARMEGQLTVLPHGNEIISLLKEHYTIGTTVQQATFSFVNALLGELGIIVLLPDNADLKRSMIPVFKDDLLHQTASGIVNSTAEKLESAGYKVQANPRDINLFYLKDDLRDRIVFDNPKLKTQNSKLSFSLSEMEDELNNNPERFSPNVILRGLYQETILPNVAFIGGGGETAYWLQLKGLFEHYKVPFPVLVLRNSFLILEKKWQERIAKLGFSIEDFFMSEPELLNRLVARESRNPTQLNGAVKELEELYAAFKAKAGAVDSTLANHVDALKKRSVERIQELEKKMLRAEKRKFQDQSRQIHTTKEALFPRNGLQERIENISYYYALWGKGIIDAFYENSLALEQEFVILKEN